MFYTNYSGVKYITCTAGTRLRRQLCYTGSVRLAWLEPVM